MASDKLFYAIFQDNPDLIVRWVDELPADAAGYCFSAPVLKEREYRLDGLFLPPDDRVDLPAIVLEAQMAPDADFLLRLYAESARFVQQSKWQRQWVVVVICPNRTMNFGPITPVREFVEQRVRWIELLPSDGQAVREPLTQVLGLLVQPEAKVRAISDDLRQQAATNPAAGQVLPLIAAILLARFNNRPISEICAMGGLTLDDFTSSRAYREIFRKGEAAGEARGEARGEASVTLRLLNRRCGPLSAATTTSIQALPLPQLESLAEALLDFTGPADLQAWLEEHG
ncbi:MAG: DUF2887 domain-containing protein [Cyanobacteria bacterium]|nr:DUF2887 domain-containing protein [Cyanobacteriota bacterium]